MKSLLVFLSALILWVLCGICTGRNNAASAGTSTRTRLVRFSGMLRDATGKPLTGATGVTFALYADQNGGSPLWLETETVTCDGSGHYSVLLGSTGAEGLPLELFTGNDERWLGVKPEGQEEQARILLVSVPYALHAEDAATLGGMTPQQLVAAAAVPAVVPVVVSNGLQAETTTVPGRPGGPQPPATTTPAAPGPRISSYLKNSTQGVVEAYNDGTSTPLQLLLNPLGGNVGVGTTSPGQKLSVAGAIESTTGGFKFPDATTQTTAGISQTAGDARYLKLSGGTLTGALTAPSFNGSGAGLSNLNATSLTGTIAPADLPGSTIGPSLQQVATLNWSPQNTAPQTFPVGNKPEAIAFDGASIWVTNKGDNTVMKLRISDGMVLGTYNVGAQPYGVTFDGANMWIANFGSANVTKLRASDGALQGTYNVGTNPIRICFDGANIWVTNYGSANVTKLSTTGATIGTYTVGTQPYGIVFDGTDIWVANNYSSNVMALKASDGSLVSTINVPANPEDMAFDGGHVWVTSYGATSVMEIWASAAGSVGVNEIFSVGVPTSGIAFDGSNIWVAAYSNSEVLKLRSNEGTSVSTVGTGTNPNSVAFDGSNIWIANSGAKTVTKIPGGGTVNSLAALSQGDFSELLQGNNTFVGYEEVVGNVNASNSSDSTPTITGVNDGAGNGVYGSSSTGVGVYASSSSGAALQAVNKNNGNYAYLGSDCCAADLYGYVVAHSGLDAYGFLDVQGTLTKTAGSFKIDDPIDPANKYLSHSFVESPDMMNIYNGNVITDGSGIADVTLPNWFMALNKDFRYQLTVIGVFAQAIIEQEITNNHFRIRTNQPNVKVSWQVTGIRHDPYADAHRIPVEEEKPAAEKGSYEFPELYGQPAEMSLRARRYPQKENPASIAMKPVAKPAIDGAVNPK